MANSTVPTKSPGDTLSHSEVNNIVAAVNSKQDDNTINSVVGNALAGKQPILVSGTNLKTINGQSLLGSSDITITSGSGSSPTTDASALITGTLPDARLSTNVVNLTGAQTLTNKTLTAPAITAPTGLTPTDVGLGNVSNKTDAARNSDVATLTNKTISGFNNTLQNIAESAIIGLVSDLAAKQATLVSGTNIRTVNGQSLLGSTDLAIAGGSATTDASQLTTGTLADARLSSNVANLAGAQTLTNKSLSGTANTFSAIPETAVTGLVSDLNAKQATLVSGTNLRTVNGQSLLGSTDLVISGGGTATTDASQLTTGILPDARLSTNVVNIAGSQTLSNKSLSGSANTFSNIPESAVTGLTSDLSGKQPTLVSGTTIKTINGNSILGSGDLTVSGGGGGSVAYTVSTLTRAAIQTAIDAVSSNGIITLSPGTYTGFDGTTLNWAGKTNLRLEGFGAAVFTTNQGTCLTFNGNNVKSRVTGINFVCTGTSGGGNGLISINEQGTDNGLEIDHCTFTSPTYRSNGISMSAYSALADNGSGQGNLKQDIQIHHNRFVSLGRMGVEFLNHTWNDNKTTVYIKNVQISYNYFNDLGKVAESYDNTVFNGMAFSNSGYAYDIKVTENEVVDANLLGIELAGSEKGLVANNTIDYVNNGFVGISISDNSHNATKLITIIGNNVRTKLKCLAMNQVTDFTVGPNTWNQAVVSTNGGSLYFQMCNSGNITGGLLKGYAYNPIRIDDCNKMYIGGGIRIIGQDSNGYSSVSIFGGSGYTGAGSSYITVGTDAQFEKPSGPATSGVVETIGNTSNITGGPR